MRTSGSDVSVASFFCDIVEDALTVGRPSSTCTNRCLALGKLVAVAGLGVSAFITVGLVSTVLSSTLVLTGIKVGAVAAIVIISHDLYVTAKKKQTTFYAPANGGSAKGFFKSAFCDTWLKPLWMSVAMNCVEVYERRAGFRNRN